MKTLFEQELYFVNKFKVGDEIRNSDYEKPEEYVTIVYIGKGGFSVYDHEDGDLYSHDYNQVDKWHHFKHPLPQILKGLKKYYQMFITSEGAVWKVEVVYLPSGFVGEHNSEYYLTEEEAKQKGLVI